MELQLVNRNTWKHLTVCKQMTDTKLDRYIHSQLVNMAPHVILTGWLLKGRNNLNKKYPSISTYEISLKRELTLKAE